MLDKIINVVVMTLLYATIILSGVGFLAWLSGEDFPLE